MGITGDRIRQCRISRHLTQDEVAAYLGVAKQTVFKYETSIITNLSLNTIERLAVLFHVSPEYLAGWTAVFPLQAALHRDEVKLLNIFRELPDEGKALLLRQAAADRILYESGDTIELKLAEQEETENHSTF